MFTGQEILIYCDKDLSLRPSIDLITWLYIISKNSFDSIDECDAITFKGGSLKSVFVQNSMNIGAFEKTEGGKSYRKVEFKSDEIQINETNDLVEDIRIYSSSRASTSLDDGSSLVNEGPFLSVDFKEASPVSDVLLTTIENVRTAIHDIPYERKF